MTDLISHITIRGTLLINEPMSIHTSLKVGGPADLYAVPEDTADLQALMAQLTELNIPWMAIGRGYNLLVRDGGICGVVISLERFNDIEKVEPHFAPSSSHEKGGVYIRAGVGAENLAVIRFAQDIGLGGIGFISGIPGTIGGALKMNAGAYGEGVLDRTFSLTLMREGKIRVLHREELDYEYRSLNLEGGDILLAATFRLDEREAYVTEEEIRKDKELRRAKHNVGFPSAGSFFKNPHGQAAWRLIDGAGMRGARVGGAQVSEVHSNFLVNTGGATARDFIELAKVIKDTVLTTSGVTLEEEVRIVGRE